MALGDSYNNNKKNEVYSPTVYSAFGFGNKESKVDPTTLKFSFWSKLLTMSIFPLKIDDKGIVSQDKDNEAKVYMSHLKAKMFEKDIRAFLLNPQEFTSSGIEVKGGLVSVSNGVEFGVNAPCIVIKNINEGGDVTATFVYEIRTQAHYTIRNFDENDKSFDKIYHAMLELEAIADLLNEYYLSMTGAMAYGVMEYSKYANNRTNNMLTEMSNALGVSTYNGKKGNNNRGSQSNSMFSNSEGRNNNKERSFDEIDAEM